MEKKLFLLDAFALIYRAYFALSKNPRLNSKGQNTSAVLGFINTVTEVVKKEKPTHIAVVFDAPGETNRVADFTEYKANREAMPEDIRWALPYIKEYIEAMNIPLYLLEGYEADDIIGTMAKAAARDGFEVFMMTPDKDYAQLVEENIKMYKPARGGKPAEVWGIEEVKEKFEVERCEQVIDILGLWGDAVDNIPGIPGIGEKTAKKLIKQYGSVEGLIEHAHELKGKQKENVINFAEQGLMSKMLATIILDVPVAYGFDEMEMQEPNKEALETLFGTLEFKNLAKRILGKELQMTQDLGGQMNLFDAPATESTMAEIKTLSDFEVKYEGIDAQDEVKVAAILDKLSGKEAICFDTETTSIDALKASLVGIALCAEENEAYYFYFPEDEAAIQKCLTPFIHFFKLNILWVAQNIKYDINVLDKYGVKLSEKQFDTMIAHYLINPEMKHNMDILAETFLNYRTISIESLIGKGKNQKSMRDVALEEVIPYACEDADITLQLFHKLRPEIEGDEALKYLFYEVEMPLARVLSVMELEGINLNVSHLKDYSVMLDQEINQLFDTIQSFASSPFNPDSPKQLGVVLFEDLKLSEKPKKTKTGQYVTSEDVLSKLSNKHDIIPAILEYRTLRKLKSTYVDALPELVHEDGRIHTSYFQTVAATGRLSSNNPNLQNIPIRTARGREIRKAFIPREGNQLLAADYSQIELRIIAALAQDEQMIAAFSNGEDIHAATAAKIYEVPLNEVTRDQRSAAKAVNFGIIYGQSAFGLSEKLNIKRTEAKEIIDAYFEQYPAIRTYMEQAVVLAKEKGYVETILGRKRYLPDINSANGVVRGFAERNAINSPIQGSAADVVKLAMIKIHKEMKAQELQSKMLLQVHDELVFDVVPSELELIKTLIKKEMESAVQLAVPLEVEMDVAENWLEAH